MKRPLILSLALLSTACEDKKKDEPPTSTATTRPATSATASAIVAAPADVPLPAGATRFAVSVGKGSFLIDAPAEKIKGSSDEVSGTLDVTPKELAKTTGTIHVRLSTLRTHTFDDADKNTSQTEHARNWMEVGNDASAATRMKFEWATLKITSIEATPASLADAKEEGGARVIKAKVSCDLTLHGVTSKKTVPVTVRLKGTGEAPTELTIKTDEPMSVSLKEHDVKPRDKVGTFLNGALERIGKKIDDKVQVSFEATAKAQMPAHP
jgi:polyisoprenoid-binding protein YceI